MHKINILTITALILLNFANAGIISLGICYTGCNILWVACCVFAELFLAIRTLARSPLLTWASHVRQGMLYMHCTGIHDLTFIYEWKPSQEVKEFSIKYLPELIQPILDSCQLLLVALQQKIPPMRPAWAESSGCSGCKYCPFKKTCWSEK
jgi:hypothetical protein